MQIHTIRRCFTNNYYKLTGKSFNPKEYKQKKRWKENKSKEEIVKKFINEIFSFAIKNKNS